MSDQRIPDNIEHVTIRAKDTDDAVRIVKMVYGWKNPQVFGLEPSVVKNNAEFDVYNMPIEEDK